MFTFLFQKKMVVFLCLSTMFFGVFCVYNNKIQLLPNVEPPKISFSVTWPGSSENFLVSDVVQPYEEAILGRLEELESLKVTTRPESASFEVTFSFGTNLEEAERKLATLLARARTLPLNVKPLTFHHGGTNVSNRVVGSYFITSDRGEFSPNQLSVISNLAKQKFKLLPGVESVELNPLLESQLQIRLDMNKLYQSNVSFDEIRQIVGGLLSQPVIRLYEDERVITAKFKSTALLEDIRQTPIAHINGVSILLKDVAQVEVSPITQTAVSRFNGQEAIAMRILRYTDANLIEVQEKVDAVLVQDASTLGSVGLTYNLSFDTSVFIERAIMWIIGSLATGFILTLFVSYCFFRRFMPTLLATLVTILSTCGVFIVLYMTKTSINVISLAGIAFAIGMFVDGVLIFVEYLDRLKPEQRSSLAKTRSSLNKLVPALLASTVTTVIVFIPVIFSQGAESQLFKGLSLAVASGLLFALFFTILLMPFFAEYFAQPETRAKTSFLLVTNTVRRLIKSKQRSVAFVVFLAGGSLLCIIIFFPSLSYLPSVKRDAVDVYIPLSGDPKIETVERNVVEPLNDILQAVPSEIVQKNNYVIGWTHFATAAVRLDDSKQTPMLISYLQKSLTELLPNNRIFVLQGELLGGFESANNIEVNLNVVDKQWLAENISAIRSIIESALPEVSIRITPDVEKFVKEYEFVPNLLGLRHSGISNEELKNLVRSIGKSDFIGKWNSDNEVINAYITIESNFHDLANIPYVSRSGVKTYVGALVNIESSDLLPSLSRLNGSNALTISLQPTSSEMTVSSIMAILEQNVVPAINEMIGHKGFVSIEGSAASLSKAKLFLTLLLLFVVLSFLIILGCLFRSVKLSMYVLFSLVPALAGSILAYNLLSWLSTVDFNVLTMLGFAIMFGIVANNSILLIDAANKVSGHCTVNDAILFAVNERVRAIAISSLTTIFGILPLLLFPSEASLIYRGIAAIIVGGIGVNLLTVLFLTSAVIRVFGLVHSTNNLPKESDIKKAGMESQC